jgi:hypothetical protein
MTYRELATLLIIVVLSLSVLLLFIRLSSFRWGRGVKIDKTFDVSKTELSTRALASAEVSERKIEQLRNGKSEIKEVSRPDSWWWEAPAWPSGRDIGPELKDYK